MTATEMLAQMSSRELTEWMAFASVEPLKEAREDLRLASLMAITANASRDMERHPDPFYPSDFIIDFWKQIEPVQDSGYNRSVAEAYAAAGLGTLTKGGE